MTVRLIAGLCLGLACAQGFAAEPFHSGDPSTWGRVKRVVAPEYPKAAVEQRRTGYIDVRGRVNPMGILEDLEYSPDDPSSRIFVDPVRKVIGYWELEPPLGRDCQPSEERVTNRVWFELKEGKPSVSVSLVPAANAASHPTLRPLHREDPIYPASLRRSGDQAVVYTRLVVAPSGEVASVEPHAYPRRRGHRTREFQQEVIRALSQWRYPPAPVAGGNRHVCYDIWFRLTD